MWASGSFPPLGHQLLQSGLGKHRARFCQTPRPFSSSLSPVINFAGSVPACPAPHVPPLLPLGGGPQALCPPQPEPRPRGVRCPPPPPSTRASKRVFASPTLGFLRGVQGLPARPRFPASFHVTQLSSWKTPRRTRGGLLRPLPPSPCAPSSGPPILSLEITGVRLTRERAPNSRKMSRTLNLFC